MTNTNRDVFAKSFRAESLYLKSGFRKLCGNLPGIVSLYIFKKIATPPQVLLELLHHSGGSQRRDAGEPTFARIMFVIILPNSISFILFPWPCKHPIP